MKRLLFLLLLIPILSFGQEVIVSGQDVTTYNGKALTYTVPVYGTEYQAVYDAFTTPPSAAIASAQNTLVETLVAAGVWTKLDVFYLFAQTTNAGGEALINWVTPASFTATLHNTASVDPTFTPLEGFSNTGNGYLKLNWIPSTDATKLSQNDASVGAYFRVATAGTDIDLGVVTNSTRWISLTARNSTDRTQCKVCDNQGSSLIQTSALGLHIGTRTAVNEVKSYRNKINISNGAGASTGVPTLTPFILSLNNVGSPLHYSAQQISLVFFGSKFLQADVDAMTDAVEVYMDSNSKGVIAYNPMEDLLLLQYLALQQRINNYESTIINIVP